MALTHESLAGARDHLWLGQGDAVSAAQQLAPVAESRLHLLEGTLACVKSLEMALRDTKILSADRRDVGEVAARDTCPGLEQYRSNCVCGLLSNADLQEFHAKYKNGVLIFDLC